MQECWRWFGPDDPVSLSDIRQAGTSGVVTALHDQPNGAVWPKEAIIARKKAIEAAGLTWSVVESIPIHEAIKLGAPGWRDHAEAWAETLKNLANQGIKTVCYNFMPVLDWTRTDLDFALPCGARALRFDFTAYSAFDLFVLERPGADRDYDADDIARAEGWITQSSATDRALLQRTIIAGLPGAEEHYTLASFREQLAKYADLDGAALRAQLKAFLDVVVPVAQMHGVRLAIHPDDPPRRLFGLPRIVSTASDLEQIFAMHPVHEHGLTLCTGSLGVISENDIFQIIKDFGAKIHFAHLRVTRREDDPRSFHEDAHLEGDVSLIRVIAQLLELQHKTGRPLPMRPDHGHRMLSDLERPSTPGYPAIGRLRGLAELRGVIRTFEALHSGLVP